VDRNLETWENLGDIESFGDATSSVIFQLPVGSKLLLFENPNFEGRYMEFLGTGSPVFIPNVSQRAWSNGDTDTEGKISSVGVTQLRTLTFFVSDERTSESFVWQSFDDAYQLLSPIGHPDQKLKIHGPRTITSVVGQTLSTPVDIRAFGGVVTLGN